MVILHLALCSLRVSSPAGTSKSSSMFSAALKSARRRRKAEATLAPTCSSARFALKQNFLISLSANANSKRFSSQVKVSSFTSNKILVDSYFILNWLGLEFCSTKEGREQYLPELHWGSRHFWLVTRILFARGGVEAIRIYPFQGIFFLS